MVEVAPLPGLAYNPFATLPEERDIDGREVVNAAFRQENDIVAATRLLSRPVFPEDPEFNLRERFEQSEFRFDYPEELGRARSADEFDAIEQRIAQERKDRETLAAAGAGGTAAAIGAGLLSPTMFVPLVGPARGATGVAQAFALAAAAGGAQEAVLFASQETRTAEEAAIGVAAATVVGGLLGSASIYMGARTRARIELDMADVRGTETISNLAGEGATQATRRAEFSPPIRNRDLPTFSARSAVGDTVMVFDSQGVPRVVQVDVTDAGGTAVFRDTNGDFVRQGQEVFTNDPRAQDARIESAESQPLVRELSDAEIIARADELEQSIEALREAGQNADVLIRDRTAVLAEAQRRARETERPDTVTQQPARPDTPANAEGQPIPRQREEPSDIERLADEADQLPEAPPLRESDAPEGRSIGAAEANPTVQRRLYRRGPVSGWVIDQLARLNPVTRGINQQDSPAASFWTARFSDAGVRVEGNEDFVPHAPGGTVENRIAGHEAALARFVQEIDDAYARHVYDDVADPEVLRSAVRATLASGTRMLPEGKLTREQFDDIVFEVANTGRAVNDPAIERAVAANRRLYDYYTEQAELAYQERLLVEPEARRLFDPEGNLGPDVTNYIHHQYDVDAIEADTGGFISDMQRNAEGQLDQSFREAWTAYRERIDELQAQADQARQSPALLEAERNRVQAEAREVAADPELAEWNRALDEMELNLRDLPEEQKADARAGIRLHRESRSDRIVGLQRRERRLQTEEQRLDELLALDDAGRAERAGEIRTRIEGEEDNFDELWRGRGAVDLNVQEGIADFAEAARERAEELYTRITGLGQRVSGMEILGGPRGPELTRVLNIPFEQKKKWLVSNSEAVARSYVRQMAADVEIYRATGSVNASSVFREIEEDFARTRQREIDRGAGQETFRRLNQRQRAVESDFRVIVERLRHQRGLPDNPNGVLYRLGRAAIDVNVFRLMGTVVPSSVPDLARTVMRSGLRRTFNAAWSPFFTDLNRVRMTRAQARRLGVALDPILHNRTQAVFELMDDYASRQTRIERGLGFLSNKTGLVAGFDRWTAEMKLMAFAVGASEFSDAMRRVVTGTGTQSIDRARTLLAAHGFDETLTRRVWDQMTQPGAGEVFDDGSILPNVENWTDLEAVAAYRSAVNKYTNDTIVTPGTDRPSWFDQNIGARMLSQVRSFTFSSTNRVVLAGLQEQDMALMNGIMFSLALGTLSYYVYSVSVGGRTLEEANQLDPAKWADEAIARSGLLGVFAEVQAIAERVPALQDYATFSGQRTTRRAASGLIGQVAGPSYGLAENISNVLLGLDEPTQSTLHQARLMAPYQNVFWFRQLLDQVEAGIADLTGLPERRDQ